jgi:transcriptional regulator with XRE-family HTH domain
MVSATFREVKAGAMSRELGAWLRQQRQARGWPVPEMGRRLRVAAKDCGDTAVPGGEAMSRNIRRWEAGKGGVSERYEMHYCKALGLPTGKFGPPRPKNITDDPAGTLAAPLPPAHQIGTLMPYGTPRVADGRLSEPRTVAYRWVQEPYMGGSWIEREVLMTAHEGSEHAEQAERRDIGEATLEQLRADVARLSHDSMTGEPFPLFSEMRRVRSRIYAALDRQLWPRDQTELYRLLALLNCLMAVTASDLGYPQAGEELVRAAWAYATAIDHRPLMGQLRLTLAGIAYWSGRPRQSYDLARSGLEYVPDGPNAAQLHLQFGRAAAHLGDAATARRAITAATEAREREYHDELLEIGGEFSTSQATHHYLAGSALIEIPEGAEDAASELERAVDLYEAGPGPDEEFGFGCRALAHIDLATVRLRSGGLDGAGVALRHVLSLGTEQRIIELPQRLGRVRAELARPRYQGSTQAGDLDEQIEEFCRETVAGDLHSLPAGPG